MPKPENTDRTPVFIGGVERSGTTLLSSIIGSHSEICIYEYDLPLWTKFYAVFRKRDLTKEKIRKELIDAIYSHRMFQIAAKNPERIVVETKLNKLNNVTIGDVFYCFLESYAEIYNKKRYGLKTPFNEFYADAIFHYFPGAVFIHMIRDPRDVGASYKKIIELWNTSKRFSDRHYHYRVYSQIDLWLQSYQRGKRNLEKYQGAYYMVRYTDLVLNPMETIQNICQQAGITFEPEMLQMQGMPKWKGSNTSFRDGFEFKKKIFTDTIGRSGTFLSEKEINIYNLLLEKHLISLAYEMHKVPVKRSLSVTLRFRFEQIKNRIKRILLLHFRGSVFYRLMRKYL